MNLNQLLLFCAVIMYSHGYCREGEEHALQREPLGRIHSGTPHPGPLAFGKGEGESSPASGVVYVADGSVIDTSRKPPVPEACASRFGS